MLRGKLGPAAVIAIEWTLITIATCIIVARFDLRIRQQKRSILASDILISLAWAAAVATAACEIRLAKYGVFDKGVTASLEGFKGDDKQRDAALRLFWLSTYPFITTLWLSKAALLATFLQIFPTFMVKRRIFLWSVIIYSALAFVASIFTYIFVCLPPEKNWTSDPDEECDGHPHYEAFDVAWALHFVGDLLVFILPWLVITELRLKRSLKIGVYCTFLLGLINIGVCIARFFISVLPGPQNSGANVALWTAPDAFIGLIIAGLPSLRPYFGSRKDSNNASRSSAKLKISSEAQTICNSAGRRRSSLPFSEHVDEPAAGSANVENRRNSPLRFHGINDELWDSENGFGDTTDSSNVELIEIAQPEPPSVGKK